MTTRVIDTIGTLQLIDTGKRCSVRDVRILCVHCTKGCGDDFLHDGILDPYWTMIKTLDGYHQGCDPDSVWRKDPAAAKLQHNATKSLLDKRDVGACIACNEFNCSGATKKTP